MLSWHTSLVMTDLIACLSLHPHVTLAYNACSAMMSGFSLFCLVADVTNKATHEAGKSAVLFPSKSLSVSLFLHIWGSVKHKGVQALATLDEKLEQTLFPKPCFPNPNHFLLFADLGVGTAQGGASPGNPR